MPNGNILFDKEAHLPFMIEYITEIILAKNFPLDDIGEMKTLLRHLKAMYVDFAFKRWSDNQPPQDPSDLPNFKEEIGCPQVCDGELIYSKIITAEEAKTL